MQIVRFAGNVAQAVRIKEDELAGVRTDLYYQARRYCNVWIRRLMPFDQGAKVNQR